MRLQKTIFTSVMTAAAFLCSACGAVVNGGTSVSQNTEPIVYRGSVVDTKEDGSIEIAQQPGHDYGQASIIFHIDDSTYIDASAGTPNQGAFVEVHYSGALSRSLPPQATAQDITVIATHTDGVVQNGTVQCAEQTDDGWRIELLPFSAESNVRENLVILTVPRDALENLTQDDLASGAQVSAITRGIATMSLPPQMPVVVLTAYTD